MKGHEGVLFRLQQKTSGKECCSLADVEREMQFDKLMEAYQNDILRLCYGMLDNMTDAEDALQDTFVKVWKSMHRYQGKNSSSVYTWIYRIAINTCKDYLRLRYSTVLNFRCTSIHHECCGFISHMNNPCDRRIMERLADAY